MENNRKQSEKLYKLEALRGFAAVYVVCYHLFASGLKIFHTDISFLFRFEQEAVLLFFILSGFVIYYSFERSKDKSLKVFFTKRFLRIYVPLVVVFITNYLLSNKTIDGRELVGNLLMLQDLQDKKPGVIVGPFLSNIPLWSLSYEWYFYFIFFFVYKKLNNSSTIVYLIALISAISYVFYPNFINRELMYFAIWWTGVDLAKLYIQQEEINFRSIRLMMISLMIICLILLINIYRQGVLGNISNPGAISEHPWLEFRHFIFTTFIILLAVLWKKIGWIGFDVIFKPFMYIAPISFGIYISHWFLVCNDSYIGFIENGIIRQILALTICIVFSWLLELKLFPLVRDRMMKFVMPTR